MSQMGSKRENVGGSRTRNRLKAAKETLVESVFRFLRFFNIKRITSNGETFQVVERPKSPPSLFLFVGECGSGKGSAITKIFNATLPKNNSTKNDASLFHHWSVDKSGTGNSIEIVEVPGLLKNDSLEEDASIITALASFLKKTFPDRIPTAVFVTASLNNNRFEGSQSTYSKSLKCLLQVRSLITDPACSNIILLLTHADRPEVKVDIEHRKNRYQHAFDAIFKIGKDHRTPPAILIGNGDKKLKIHSELKKIMSQTFFQNKKIDFSHKIHKSSDLLPRGSKVLIRKVVLNMTKDNTGPCRLLDVNDDDSDSEDTGGIESGSRSFGVIVEKIVKNQPRGDRLLNCVHASCVVFLASGTAIAAKDSWVGDRVLGLNSSVGVITDKKHFKKNEGKSEQALIFATSVANKQDELVYSYNATNRAFILQELGPVKNRFLNKMKGDVYYIEVKDVKGNPSTFIADGVVRVCQEI